MSEIYLPVEGFDGYEVSNMGNVRSIPRPISKTSNKGKSFIAQHKGKTLKGFGDTVGYKIIGMYKDGKHYYTSVHRLVAKTFIPNPDNLPQVNHIDGNKSNNKVTNLEWCTAQQNMLHARENGLIKRK